MSQNTSALPLGRRPDRAGWLHKPLERVLGMEQKETADLIELRGRFCSNLLRVVNLEQSSVL